MRSLSQYITEDIGISLVDCTKKIKEILKKEKVEVWDVSCDYQHHDTDIILVTIVSGDVLDKDHLLGVIGKNLGYTVDEVCNKKDEKILCFRLYK